jgi:hypothetical protein
MKDGAVDFELTGPRPDDEVDCCAAVGGPMAAKAAGLPDAASGLVLDGKSQTFDAAVSIHRKLPEMVDRRKELIFGRTSSAPVPHLEWSYDPGTWPNVAEQLVEAIKEPFAALTRYANATGHPTGLSIAPFIESGRHSLPSDTLMPCPLCTLAVSVVVYVSP